jgi:hypothetical protein
MTIGYILFAIILFSDIDDNWTIAPIFYLWIVGGLLYAATITYAARTNAKTSTILTVILSGTVWVFPPLMFTVFGIPFLIVYSVTTGHLIVKTKTQEFDD